jgi:hypothetical protein
MSNDNIKIDHTATGWEIVIGFIWQRTGMGSELVFTEK